MGGTSVVAKVFENEMMNARLTKKGNDDEEGACQYFIYSIKNYLGSSNS